MCVCVHAIHVFGISHELVGVSRHDQWGSAREKEGRAGGNVVRN